MALLNMLLGIVKSLSTTGFAGVLVGLSWPGSGDFRECLLMTMYQMEAGKMVRLRQIVV